jgi:glucose/arabinose dehydrogenase
LKRLFALTMILLIGCQSVASTATLSAPTRTSISTKTALPQPTNTSSPTPIPTIPAAVVELNGAEVPQGFSLIRFADLYRPTAFAFDAEGRMYVTSQDGNVYILRDEDKDGRADSRSTFATGYYFPVGVAVHIPSGDVYVSYQGAITILSDTDKDERADTEKIFVDNLPTGKHQNDNLKFGSDGKLYVGVGSACDACEDSDPRSATILRFDITTGTSEIFATGMRNPYDLAFQPLTGELFATDNGRDDLGMDAPFEELNHIVQGGDYGYPGCWNEQTSAGCESTLPAVAFFEPHSSADGLDFYNGNTFPADYRGNAFVSIFGSWLKPNVQTGIQRVVLSKVGNSYRGEASWFVHFPQGSMPLPVLFGPDDALYVGDYIQDAIYRISYGLPP